MRSSRLTRGPAVRQRPQRGSSREEDAHITGEWVLLVDAVRMVLTGEICDMKARDVRCSSLDKLHHDWQLG